jgi:hypothetical protein
MLESLLEFGRFQYLSILGSIAALLFIVELIRRRKIKEEYSLLWLLLGFSFLVISFSTSIINKFSKIIGISYAPAALLLFLVLGSFAILIHFSIVITKLSHKNKDLVQELSLLKFEFERFKNKLENKDQKVSEES